MFRISFVADRRCRSHRKYFGGTEGTAMKAFSVSLNTVNRSVAAARYKPLQTKYKVSFRCFWSWVLSTSTYVLALIMLTGFDNSELEASDELSVATREGGWDDGVCPALTRSIASIISSKSASVAPKGT